MGWTVLDTMTEYFHHATFGDLALQPRQELLPPGTVSGQSKLLNRLRLGGGQKSEQLGRSTAWPRS
jgi:hypothetical protein